MAYIKVSIPKKSGGAPVPKDSNVIFIDANDIERDESGKITGYPTRNAGGVMMVGNFVLKANAKAFGVYMTPSTIKRNDTSEGDPDAEGFVQNFSGERPGSDLAFDEFIQNNISTDFIIITRECSDETGTRVHGTPCNPMKMTFEEQDDNEAKKATLTFASARSKFKKAHYNGTIPALYTPAAEPEGSGSAGGGV